MRSFARVAFLLGSVAAAAQISPGPLSRAHSFLNGATNCTSCHRVGGQASFKCLDCHTEIASRIAAGRGLHARVAPKATAAQACASCHSEHNGENFALIKWEPSQQQFDHSRTGWPLAGKHATLSCASCHKPENIAAAERTQIKMKDLGRTFLGLSTDCASCHADPHKGQLGATCTQCHNAEGWKKVPSFDHSRTRFALTGAHARVACDNCHKPAEAGGPVRFRGLPFERCSDCHNDPHRGSFAATCQSCHSTATWKSVSAAALQARFDHSKTQYPLLGKHALLQCSQCHAGGDFKKTIAFQKCTDCHRDIHGGQFLKRADAGQCSSCHTVEGFKPAKFGLAEHKTTAYPLEGKHAALKCDSCHIPAGAATLYRIKFGQCVDCHKDAHGGQFAAAPNLNRCEGCHTVHGFQPSTFTLARHQASKFPLHESHMAVACNECHRPSDEPAAAKLVRFRFGDNSCTQCHQDPHGGQFRERMIAVGTGGKAKGCEACHSLKSWKELSSFDHAATKFPLLGSHRAVACADCHRPANMEVSLAKADFRSAPTECEGCHKDPHGGQFKLAGVAERCASCHNTNKWRPSLFDHDRRTKFPLQGVHKNVACERCHTGTRLVNGAKVLFYKPTPVECASCHGANGKSSSD